MMSSLKTEILLGYEYDSWMGYGAKVPIRVNVGIDVNKHTLIAGASGGGKSYFTNQYMARLCMKCPELKVFFADFKREDAFKHLRGCKNYFSFNKCVEALDIVHDILYKRQSGADESRTPVYLFWDEYLASVLSLKVRDKKKLKL